MLDRSHERYTSGRVLPGMEVCNSSGDKIGSIARVHHMNEVHGPASEGRLDQIMEVKTGFLGFGKRFYVPLSDVQEVFRETTFLSRTKSEIETLGYQTKPTHLQ